MLTTHQLKEHADATTNFQKGYLAALQWVADKSAKETRKDVQQTLKVREIRTSGNAEMEVNKKPSNPSK